jgi:uncharacterized protein (DUF1778 family)
MTTSSKIRGGAPRPDRYSDKTGGKMRQTLRLSPEQNQLLRDASEEEGLSINSWAIRILVKAARAQLTTTTKLKTRKRVKIG